MSEDRKELYFSKDIILLFGISYRTLDRWLKNGYLKSIKIGAKKRMFCKKEIDAMLSAKSKSKK
jgi:predicted site-specific integrase-resolvase